MTSRSLSVQLLLADAVLAAIALLAVLVGVDGFHGTTALALAAALLALMLNALLLWRHGAALESARTATEALHERLEGERRAAGLAVIRMQERERQRLARDLHDEVNQALTAILLRLEATLHDAPPALRDELRATKQLATQAMDELLRLARQLRPAVLDDHGLMPALHTQVRDFAEQTGIRATFHHRGPTPRLSPEQQMTIYRVTQEGLSNVAQHADARNVRVELSFVGRTVLRISDDGHGFQRRRDDRLGLDGMRERALLAGGHLSIWSEVGQGTRVELTI